MNDFIKSDLRTPFQGKKVAVVGAGKSGLAALKLLNVLGAKLKLAERDAHHITKDEEKWCQLNDIEIILGAHKAEDFKNCDLVITSPGVPLKKLSPVIKEAEKLKGDGDLEIISELELALHFIDEPLIAVTGTSGKTTTVHLIEAMLKASGKKVFLGGNVGTPLTEYVYKKLSPEGERHKVDNIVLECSSFQLSTTKSLHARVAVFLNLTENHLDQHLDMKDYTDAKFKIFQNQTKDDLALLGPDIVGEYKKRDLKAPYEVFHYKSDFKSKYLKGPHNLANMEAAYKATKIFGVSQKDAQKALESFQGLPHRLEIIDQKDGIKFINDSKGTTVTSLEAALKSFNQPIILLAGGIFKGGDLKSLKPLLEDRVKHIALYGRDREIFAQEWQGFKNISQDENMTEAIKRVKEIAKMGDCVLLSPATSSYDQYEDYIARGDDFRRLVEEW